MLPGATEPEALSRNQEEGSGEFYEVEMSVDERFFDGDINEISEGNFVSFKYLGEHGTYGPPLNPKIYAIRSEIQSWDQLHHARRKPPKHERIWGMPLVFDWKELSSRKAFFDEFARDNNFDPLVSGNWYDVTYDDILGKKGGHGVISRYDDLKSALFEVYPNIGLQAEYFRTVNFWTDKQNCKEFLDRFAFINQFDPLVPNNWYNVVSKHIARVKGGRALLVQYNQSIPDLVADIYPFIGLEANKFKVNITKPPIAERVRIFFDTYARNNNFDPLVPENWHDISYKELVKAKGEIFLRKYSLIGALKQAYPDVKFKENDFNTVSKNYWVKPENRKGFFNTIAESKGFDPLLPQNWYLLATDDILKVKGGTGVMKKYNSSFVAAVMAAYPNIGLEGRRFLNQPKHFWSNVDNVRSFFNALAKTMNFEVHNADKWKEVTRKDVEKLEGGSSILRHFDGQFEGVLNSVFPGLDLPESTKRAQ